MPNKYKKLALTLFFFLFLGLVVYSNSPNKSNSDIIKLPIKTATVKQIEDNCTDIGPVIAHRIKEYMNDNRLETVEEIDVDEIKHFNDVRYEELCEHFY